MSGSLFDLIYGGSTAQSAGCDGLRQAMAANQAAQMGNAAASLNSWSWSTPLPREPGIYWTRTGGKTHTVEVVR